MARGINKVILVGRLGADPDSRTMPSSETVVTNLSLATSENWTTRDGEKKEKTEWHRVVFFDRVAEIARDHLKKGSLIYIEGKLQSRKFEDKNGIEKWTTEVIVRFPAQLQMLGKKDDFEPNHSSPNSHSDTDTFNQDDEFDDDIPF